ncbi:SWIM zinc finger family protein [Brevibacillus choshinensis]|uniref:SWIM zinc finger family protein n=1 Tax=Brevibacillus choshinensis TaxID=54911 RepID=UPI002E1C7486|nr:SWIM zinc finger family protein [Brevibacillus choshinensis]MED4750903.1 SWIM zinc finger family protein [Brevibacillus choshinensis]
MLQRELTREQAVQAGEQLLVFAEGSIIERGYSYFSDGVVFNTRVEKGKLLTSDVQGSQVYHVELDLEDIQNSTCTCPYTRLCKHMAATFFQMYSVFENPRHYLTRAQQPRRAKFSPAMLVPAYKNLSLPSPQEGTAVQSPLKPDSPVHEWWTFLENWTRNLPSAMETYRASSELLSSFQNVLGVAAAWPPARAQLFTVHANVFHLLKLQDFVKTNRQSYWFQDLSQTAERLLEQLEGTLFYMDIEDLRERHHELLEQTMLTVKKMKDTESTALYWTFAYQLLWWNLLQVSDWIQAEINDLDQRIKDPSTATSAKEVYKLLRAHFYVMEGADDAAIQTWRSNSRLSLSFYLPYLKMFARNEDWPRFLAWTEALQSLIGSADPQNYQLVAAIWQEAMERVGRGEECGAMLKQFLPSSFHEYAAYLYEQKQFRQWIDLQMSYQVPITEVITVQFKEMEDTHPTLLFPLYLREVNRLIAERNRSAYKEAIKLLKKIRTAYSKANQEARWERYVDQLGAKHNRLRAFQEELKRGNLNL